MAEITNKGLTVLLVIAMVVSIGGALVNISKIAELAKIVPISKIAGLVTTIGTVNITLQSNVQINLSTYQIEFGPGWVTPGMGDAARLNTTAGTKGKENWTNASGYVFLPNNITVENTGNRNVSVNFTSDKLAAAFIGGGAGSITDPVFQFKGKNKEFFSCNETGNLTTSWTSVITAEANVVCKCMDFVDSRDEIFVNVQVLIPSDVPVGGKNATLTFTGSDWSGTNKDCWTA